MKIIVSTTLCPEQLNTSGAISHTLHYAAIESNRELNKSLKVIALLLLIFGPNLMIFFLLV